MKNFYILTAFLFVFLLAKPAFADTVTQFVFTTVPQTIGISTPSEIITIQSQNSTGGAEDITETFDLVFTSTSATGVFQSTSGNPVSTTMSRNTANKNFLYQDSTAGTHTITILATGRTSLQSFSASQQIVVTGESITNDSENNQGNNTENNNATTTSSSEKNTSVTPPPPVIIYSAHSSPSPLSNTENKIEFEVSGGRDRLTSVGNLVSFKAVATKLQNIAEQNITYVWSFGDGTIKQGNIVNHAYKIAGEYVVVLNATYSDKQAVSRLVVKVISPDLTMSKVSDGIEISNKSSSEINLESWGLVSMQKSFIFPKDTLIPGGKKVAFSNDVINISGETIELRNPLGKSFGVLKEEKNVEKTTVSTPLNLSDIQAKIDDVKNKLVALSTKTLETKNDDSEAVPIKVSEQLVALESTESEVLESNNSQTANVIEVFKAEKQTNLASSVLSWPVRGFNFIKHIFVRD